MKISYKNWFMTLVAILLLGIILVVALYIFFTKQPTIYDDNGNLITVVKSIEYHSPPIRLGDGIPHKKIKNPGKYSGLSIDWAMYSVVDGADVCVLYDNKSMQKYAESNRTIYPYGHPANRTDSKTIVYFDNKKIDIEKSMNLLNRYCYIDDSLE